MDTSDNQNGIRKGIPKKYAHVPIHLVPETSSFRCATGVKNCIRELAKRNKTSMTKVILSAIKTALRKNGFRDDPSLRNY